MTNLPLYKHCQPLHKKQYFISNFKITNRKSQIARLNEALEWTTYDSFSHRPTVSADSSPLAATRCQCYKTFFHILRMFLVSQSVCPWQAFLFYSNKHSGLVWKSVNHGPKKFYNIGSRCQCYKTFFLHRTK